MTDLKLYNPRGGLNVCIGTSDTKSTAAPYVVGLSLGALVALKEAERITGKIILINPPLPKRSLLVWLVQWVKFIKSEGLFFRRQKFTRNPLRFVIEIVNCVKLLNIDFSKVIENIPFGNLIVVRGRGDRFFCDDKAVDYIRSKNIKLIEVDGGHNWCENMEEVVNNLTI